jgi:hypothetical protein
MTLPYVYRYMYTNIFTFTYIRIHTHTYVQTNIQSYQPIMTLWCLVWKILIYTIIVTKLRDIFSSQPCWAPTYKLCPPQISVILSYSHKVYKHQGFFTYMLNVTEIPFLSFRFCEYR